MANDFRLVALLHLWCCQAATEHGADWQKIAAVVEDRMRTMDAAQRVELTQELAILVGAANDIGGKRLH